MVFLNLFGATDIVLKMVFLNHFGAIDIVLKNSISLVLQIMCMGSSRGMLKMRYTMQMKWKNCDRLTKHVNILSGPDTKHMMF